MHRVAQFFGHVTARVSADEEARARSILPASARSLFDGMPIADRRHALDVVERLLAAGIDDRDVLTAALLHDAAKGHRMRLWHRVAGVLLEALAPSALGRLASPNPRSWRYPFHLYVHHAVLSAGAALAGGCSERSAGFIRGSVGSADGALLTILKAADEAS